MEILKIYLPAEVIITIVKGKVETLNTACEIILDFERQLNNLKITSEVNDVILAPRIHLSEDLNKYHFLSKGGKPSKGWPTGP